MEEPEEDVSRISYQVHEVQLDNKNPFGRSLNFFEGNETKDECDLRLELEKIKRESNLQHVNHKAKTNFLDEITKSSTKNELDFEAEMRKPSDDLNLLPKTKKSFNRTNRPSNIKDCVEMALKNAIHGLGGPDSGENPNMKSEAPRNEKGTTSLHFLDDLLFKDLPKKSSSCGSKKSSASIDDILKEITVASRQCEFWFFMKTFRFFIADKSCNYFICVNLLKSNFG